MNKIYYDKLPDEYKSYFIGTGYNGRCYYAGNNTVYKEFYYPSIFKDNISKLSNIKIPSFIFPNELVYVKDKFVGYTMDYVDGATLDALKSAPLTDYLKEIILFEYNIASLSNKKIFLSDLKDENIIFTKDNKLRVIDTDFYCKSNNKDLYRTNLHFFSTSVLNPIMNVYTSEFNNNNLNYHKELLIDGRYLPSKFLIEVLKDLRRKLNNEINNINDVRNSLKLILK